MGFEYFNVYLRHLSATTAVVRNDFIEKVLLKLSSKVKLRNFDYGTKMIAVAPHLLVCIATIGSLHTLWCGLLLLYPYQGQCEGLTLG